MSHTTEISGPPERLSNGQFLIRIMCCGEHEHRRTIGPLVEDVAASIEEAHKQAAKEHEASIALEAQLESMSGSKKQHP